MSTTTKYDFYVKKGGSGRVHHSKNCSGGIAPHVAQKVSLTVEQLVDLMTADATRTNRICPCAWRRAERIIEEGK